MRIDITAHPAEDITLDLGGVRELQAENARLNTDRETMQTHIRELQAQLEEARKQPVALLPEITDDILKECRAEWFKDEYGGSDGEQGRAATTVLRRHFREAAEARVKPQVDVEAVVDEIACKYNTLGTWLPGLWTDLGNILRIHVTDAPGENFKANRIKSGVTITADGIIFNGVKIGPEQLQKVQQLPDEKSLRRQIAAYLRANGERIETGEMSVLDAAREIELGAGAQPVDETLVAAVARAERETRAKCAEMVMDWNPCNETRRMLADRMERGG